MFLRKRRSNINKSNEENASGKWHQWLGLEPMSYIPSKDKPGEGVVTARLRDKAGDYVGKDFMWQNRRYFVSGVTWGTNGSKFVALHVTRTAEITN